MANWQSPTREARVPCVGAVLSIVGAGTILPSLTGFGAGRWAVSWCILDSGAPPRDLPGVEGPSGPNPLRQPRTTS